ncbi:hypothetical protein NGRA_2627 [Nosema granulosis]|uniref:Uncharacterized protein n=1 Tax=Nosema granulosis TaxID=83296 RepID=A0A9P6GZH7_9MICR|nr:hypothetical protein NGRA_2627 [Nosema granulosis]
MGGICSCMKKNKPKCIVSVIGLEEDVKNVLAHIVPDFNREHRLGKFSEYVIKYNEAELLIYAHISNPMIKNLINLHSTSEYATIYAINADNKNSVENAKAIIDDQERSHGKLIAVLCRGRYLDNPDLDEIKYLFNENIHDSFEFVKFTEEDTEKYVKLTFDKIHNRISDD